MILEERFWLKVGITDDCWLWTDSLNIDGYGRFRVGDHKEMAHRISYELAYGKISEGLEIDHLCRERSCMRPSHLESVTHLENIRRGDLSNNGSWNRIKTSCLHGHKYDEDNTYIDCKGKRTCRSCHRLQEQIRRLKVRI